MSDAITRHTVTVPPEADGERLDRFLAGEIAELSRSRVQSLIKAGALERLGGAIVVDVGLKVHKDAQFILTVPAAAAAEPAAEDIPLTVVHEDEDVIVIDKPAGLVVHPAAGHATGTLVNALIAHCGDSLSGVGGVRRPGIVHRLDKDTSGLLVVAKNDLAHQNLAEQFAAHGTDGRLERRYLALVWGRPERASGTIATRIARSTADRMKFAVTRGALGREAVTHYEVLKSFGDDAAKPLASLLSVALETGRTHQIRVHMTHLGHPVLGDQIYGKGFQASARKLPEAAQVALAALGRQALHAAVLGFEHPRSGKRLRFESALPADMAAVRSALAKKPRRS